MLRESLVGNSKTVMLATISPASTDVQETLSTLRFAASVKKIRTTAKQNAGRKDELLSGLQAELRRLKKELEAFPDDDALAAGGGDRKVALHEDIAERERLLGDLRKSHERQIEEAR